MLVCLIMSADCLYIGDAAGRPAEGTGKSGIKKDFSACDLKFAINAGIAFATPEQAFQVQRLVISSYTASFTRWRLNICASTWADGSQEWPQVPSFSLAACIILAPCVREALIASDACANFA